ncbi:MAG: hypothetical protein FJ077_01555 [Cyanobacteria bacterium K_DeepCast_35m_m2_023]|nr:hypothetical protein [Cyanobacteria bacterium K_DeepCast_35m_m2_023]
MTTAACLKLVHQAAHRRRYRILSRTPIAWQHLERHLAEQLPGLHLGWRINRSASSITLQHRPNNDGLIDGPHTAESELKQGLQVLTSGLQAAGATPPAAEVIQIQTRRQRPNNLKLADTLLNLLSGSVSVVLVLVACALFVFGVIGLMLPLAPGAPFLLLGYLVMELAYALRRPFVATSVA